MSEPPALIESGTVIAGLVVPVIVFDPAKAARGFGAARYGEPLSRVEKAAGRVFRDAEQAKLTASFEADPPTSEGFAWSHHWRHECPARGNRSLSIEVAERYVFSPAYRVTQVTQVTEHSRNWDVVEITEADLDDVVRELRDDLRSDPDLVSEIVPARRFGFYWREGRCRAVESRPDGTRFACPETVRCRAGVFVDARVRPPLSGRSAR